jgi:predicted DNA-binding mobile mystery protein A
MRNEFKDLRLQQLDRTIHSFPPAQKAPRPQRGWIHAVRQALGIPASELGRILGTNRQLPLQLEKSEASDSITLKSLRRVADAFDCDLVYAFVPRAGTLQNAVEARALAQASKTVRMVEHSMALEDQAAGHLEQAVATEARRILQRKGLVP